jgi:predicted RNA-binding protein with PIN domain
MWDANTNIIDWIDLSNKRKILIKKVISYFNVSAKGVAIVIDNKCYKNFNNPTWRYTKAIHMNIRDGGIEEKSPERLLKIMRSKKYSHLIWVAGDVSKGKDIEFVWVLAHELRHLEQDLISIILSKAGKFLRNTLGNIETDEQKIDLMIPTELDAELAAWRVTRNIFGNKIADLYVLNNDKSGKRKESFQFLLSYDPEQKYNIIGNTIRLLKKYQNQLEIKQKNSRSSFIKKFNIDEALLELESLELLII